MSRDWLIPCTRCISMCQ